MQRRLWCQKAPVCYVLMCFPSNLLLMLHSHSAASHIPSEAHKAGQSGDRILPQNHSFFPAIKYPRGFIIPRSTSTAPYDLNGLIEVQLR